MEFEYSPRHHHSPSSALPFLSPSHHHPGSDSLASIRQLRRSLSRSPSKPARFQLFTKKTSYSSPAANTAASPPAPSGNASTIATSDTALRNRPTVKRGVPLRTSSRRNSPNSPIRRALSENSNQANSAPRPIRRTSSDNDQENMDCSEDMTKKTDEARFDDDPIRLVLTKPRMEVMFQPVLKEYAPPKSSPLKRSDGVMNLEAASSHSPRVKRRSLHGACFGTDFNIFDHAFDGSLEASLEQRDEDETERDAASASMVPTHSPAATQSPNRRPFSLRKSTLQQRSGPARSRLFADIPNEVLTSPAMTRARSRISLDSALPLRSFDVDSPFRRSTASDPPVTFAPPAPRLHQSAPKPHPLSHALTPSSSTSSMPDAPTPSAHESSRQSVVEQTIPKLNPVFSKSLPIGAMRPTSSQQNSSQGSSSQDSFATPEGYKMAKPLPQAFMSTGLISKRNRNIDMPATFGAGPMPDTPSKKAHVHIASTPAPSAVFGKMNQPVHEFGSPSTPYNGRTSKLSPESFGKGSNIFGAHAPQHTRRGSFLGLNCDDQYQSPTNQTESQSSADELPPTPTKSSTSGPRPQSKGKSNSLRSSLFGRRTSLGPDTFTAPSAEQTSPHSEKESKYSPWFDKSSTHKDKDSGEFEADEAATPFITFTSCTSTFTRAASARVPTTPRHASAKTFIAAASDLVAASEVSPHTPSDSFTPPDASKLSISAEHRSSNLFPSNSFPPATPTGPRDQPFNASLGQSFASSSGYFANDVDTSLTSRFGHVTTYGIGEFSQVYRVEKALTRQEGNHYSPSAAQTTVWAVKKSRKAYIGHKDRQRKMQEVHILKQLRGHEHVITFVDDWESKNHLYIQTEFCENGNLKDFLSQTGFKGRLDDFRIWKILLELSQGVKSIHDANIIHLDIKPANVFIDWEGVLKIGDFGLASTWPAPPGLDGEGDREYIGPEVLSGRFDKPADIFSLGMVMLEIAGNIVLPDNGSSWQRLRAGDMSDLPSLTWSSDNSLVRDESGDPVELLNGSSSDTLCTSQDGRSLDDNDDDDDLSFLRSSVPRAQRSHELVKPPNFMIDPNDPEALDRVVQWMICPHPDKRPVVDQLLAAGGVQWVERRRRAGASVYEGNWGPADDVLGHEQDVEMLDI